MDSSREYSEMMGNKYKSVIITPLISAWEFMGISKTREETDWKDLSKMSSKYKWNLHLDLEEILKHIDNVIVITDKDQKIKFISSGFEKMTGYNKKEVMGKNPQFLQGIDTDRETSKRIGIALNEAKPVSAVVLNYKKDNSPYYCKLDITPVFNQNSELVHFIAIEKAVNL